MQVTVTLGSIETKTIENGPSAGQKYTTARKSIAHFAKGDREVTVMAFAAQRDSVSKLLRKGKRVTLTAMFDGNMVLKVLGPQQVDAPAEAA